MNPYYNMQNVPMIMPFNFNKNLYGMNNFNPMWNMNPFGLLDQMNIMKQNMGMLNIQGGNSKPKSESITLIFIKKNKQNIFIETSLDESMASEVNILRYQGITMLIDFIIMEKKLLKFLQLKKMD